MSFPQARDSYLAREARRLREAPPLVREPLGDVQAAKRKLVLTLSRGEHKTWVEVAVWTPTKEGDTVLRERGRVCLRLGELDELIAKLQAARERLSAHARKEV